MAGTIYIANAFSLGMLDGDATLSVKEVTDHPALPTMLKERGFVSALGHEATAKVVSKKLGLEVPANRVAIKLKEGDLLIVFQLLQRLPEGKVLTEEEIESLPMKVYMVEVLPKS